MSNDELNDMHIDSIANVDAIFYPDMLAQSALPDKRPRQA
jgi:hypothetical protein